MSYEFHTPVLLHKAIDFLINPEKNHSLIVDCTTGGGGYGLEICRRVYPNVNLICLDKDLEALNHAKITLEQFSDKISYINGNFGELDKILDELNIDKLDGIVFDLGLSSYQIEKEDGFSFMRDTPLDMRAYKKDDLTAKDIINNYNTDELTRIFSDYGDIANPGRLADLIDEYRSRITIATTFELLDVINKGYKLRDKDKYDFYAKIFQALRIEVNRELDNLNSVLYAAESRLMRGGRLVSVAYHSLEDRMVRNFLRERRNESFKILTGKSIKPDYKEIQVNRRARSAKLRCAEKL